MSSIRYSANYAVYNSPDVVAHYAALGYLTCCERQLFDSYLRPGMAILDLGVGAGRTTPYLLELASQYIGVDFSEEMIRVCRTRFPQLRFAVMDASDLSDFKDESFDAVVFSFNGLDYLVPDEKRHQCIRECGRVLKRDGVLIFSSHNPRALFIGWRWDRDRLRKLAERFSRGARLMFYTIWFALTCARITLATLKTIVDSIPRAARRLPTGAFWRGDGYIFDQSHGGLLTHAAVPSRVIAELAEFRFELRQVMPEDYPEKARSLGTRWFYYVFAKVRSC